jgi:hypothetical protein
MGCEIPGGFGTANMQTLSVHCGAVVRPWNAGNLAQVNSGKKIKKHHTRAKRGLFSKAAGTDRQLNPQKRWEKNKPNLVPFILVLQKIPKHQKTRRELRNNKITTPPPEAAVLKNIYTIIRTSRQCSRMHTQVKHLSTGTYRCVLYACM